MLTWPPAYTIKKHRRAKYVKLRTSTQKGLIVTVPYRFNLKNLPAIMEEHRAWIMQQLTQLANKKEQGLPTEISLLANETWRVTYIACNSKLELIERPMREITLVGRIENTVLCKNLLLNWLKAYAKNFLLAEMERLSRFMQLHFASIAIRDQQTRWGSCSADKAINLNFKLIFLPSHLVQHVLIHELCHTVYLNHSVKFWHLVEKFDENWQAHRIELRHAEKYIPTWL